jgi:mRNA-degrading endonuclease toxin of MazEF toxin-antitoxin module
LNYKVGDVVCATYGNFTGEKAVGIFLIIYSERQDRIYTDGHSNYNAVKITTNNFLGDSYTVRLYEGDANLENSCLVNISKVHTLSKEQVYKKIGTLRQDKMLKVFKELRNFNSEVESQIMEVI